MEKLSNKVVTSYRVVGATKIDAPVKGAKAGDKPRQPKIAKDSVASISTAKILYGLNDGEISGIVGGAKGIFLENTPLEDEAGNSNFEGIKWDFRAGTIDQEYIEGFPDLSNEIGVGTELKSGTDWIRAISNTALSAVRIRLSWNGLRKTNTENGDVSGYKIEYAIDIKTGSGAYQEALRTNINDKVTGKYERTHRIELPKSPNGWQIRVRRITPNANLDHILDKMYIEAITEVIDQKFTYPHTTLLGLQYDATTFSNIAKLAVRAKGKLIKIPTNYDSVSNTYSGIWNGQFKLAYSDNPAWIFYDLVLSDRYGLGRRIDASMVDKWALYSISQYCDELVDDGEGGLEKRYSCNVYLQSQEDAYKVLSQLAGIFRGLTYWSGQQLVLSADVPKEPSYTFSRANVIDGEFEYSGTALNDRHTVAKVAWDNPKENFKTEYEFIRDEEAISQFGVNSLTLAAIGCTSRGQAQRAGLWALKSEQLETEIVSFRTGLEGFNLVVGEVIEVSDSLLAGRENGGRIVATTSNLKSVTIDRDAIVKVNDFISVNAKDGTSQRRKVIAVSGRTLTVLTPFVGVEAGAVWAVSSIDLNTMLFRIMSIKPDEDHIYTITAIQHEPLKYDAVDFGADVKPTNISILKPTNVEPPATVGVSARYRVVQAQSVATLVIQWSQVKDAVAYSVEWRRNSGNWIKIPNTKNVSAEVDGVYAGDYQVRVKSINAFDVESNYITSSITPIAGKVGNPKSLAFISATGLLFGMSISWNFQAGSEDTSYTEIEVATDATGTNTALLGMFSYPTNKTEVTGLQGGLTLHYRGRIVDKLGNASSWSNWISGTTSEDANKVLDLLDGQITESQLYTDLSAKINSIDTNKTILDELGTEINAQIAEANNDILAANALIETNKQAANAAINEANDDIAEIRTVIDSNLLSTNTAINDAKAVIAANKTEVNTALNTVNNKIDTNKTATNSAIAEANVLINANKDKLLLTDADLVNVKNSINSNLAKINLANTAIADSKVLIDANKADLATNKTELEAAIAATRQIISNETINRHNEIVAEAEARVLEDDKLRDSIVSESQARQTATGALTTQFNGIYAQVNPKLIGDENDLIGNESNFVGVWSEQSARIEGDLSLGIRVDGLAARTDTNTASITEQYKVLTDKDQSLASSITTLSTDFNNNKSIVSNTLVALSNKDQTLTSSISSLESAYNDNKAAVSSQITSLTDKDTALTNSITSLTATVGANTASISNNYNTLVNADSALSSSIGTLETAYNANKASVNNALTVLTNKDKSLAEDITTLNSNVAGNTATISSNYTTLVNRDTAITNSLNALDADYKGNKSKVATDIIALVNTDTATNNLLTTLDSDYKTNKASVNNSLTTLTNKDTALTNSITSLTSTVGTNTANISSNYNTLVNKDKSLTKSINSLNTEYNNNKSTVSNKLTVLTDKDTALTSSIDSLTSEYNTNKAKIVTDLKTLSDKDTALTSSINTLSTTVESNTASIISNYNTLSDANTATANKLDGVYAQVNPDLIGSENDLIGDDTKFSGVWSEQSARIEEDLALSLRSDNLASQLVDNKALISQNYTTLVNADLATASLITSLKTDYEGNKTTVSNSLTALSSKDTSLANSITLLTSDYNNNKTSVSNTLTSLADKDITLANSITALDTAYKDNKTSVSNSLTALSNEDTVLGSRITTLDTDYKSNKTSVSNSLTALSNKDISLASDITLLKTKTDNTNAEVNTAKTAISNNTSSIAQAKTELTTSYTNAISSAITTEATARSNADTALSGRIDTLTTTVGTNTAAIQTEASTRASADTANANLITTVQSTVAGHTSSIQSQSTAINGLSAQWTMKLDVNGYVSGVGQYNNGTTSQFAILADKFYIANPNTNTSKALFQVLTQPTTINGVTVPSGMYLNGDFIATGSITGDKIRANTSITAPTINGGSVNINDKFIVDSSGNLTAKSGTFEGTVLANQISGTIDIATMKRSAWTAGYKLFIIKDLSAPKNTPSDFNSVRQYSSLIPSYGGLSWSTGSDSSASEIGGAMFEIEIDAAQATTVTQKAFVIDNLLRLYVNNNYIGQYNDRHPDANNGGLISYNLVKGINKIQYILINNGSECSLSLLGDFIDNYNVKFN